MWFPISFSRRRSLGRPRPVRNKPDSPRLALEALEERAVPAGGDLDLSFGASGRQTVPGLFDAAVHAMAIDAQGRIVLAGTAEVRSGDFDFAVARLNPNGSLDTSFSGDGIATIPFNFGGGNDDEANAMVIDAQGRIVLSGFAQASDSNPGDYDFAIARLNSDGSLDPSFGSTGKVSIPFDLGGFDSDYATAMAIDAQGRIIVAGYAERGPGNYDFGVARLISNGRLDSSFGVSGKQTVAFDLGGSNGDFANAVVIDAQQRIILGGSAHVGTFEADFAVARLNSNGDLDRSFGSDGKKTIAFNLGGFDRGYASAMVVDAQGRILLAGTEDIGDGDGRFAVARLNPDGSLDTSFNSTGKQIVTFNLGTHGVAFGNAAAIDVEGRIIVAGSAGPGNGEFDFAAARLMSNGSLDATFGDAGTQTIAFNLGGKFDNATAMAIDAQGRIVLAGSGELGDTTNVFAITRLISDVVPGPLAAPRGIGPGVFAFHPFLTTRGKVLIVLADVTGDGADDVVFIFKNGSRTRTLVLNGVTHQLLPALFSFHHALASGVFCAWFDLNGDSRPDLILGLHGIRP